MKKWKSMGQSDISSSPVWKQLMGWFALVILVTSVTISGVAIDKNIHGVWNILERNIQDIAYGISLNVQTEVEKYSALFSNQEFAGKIYAIQRDKEQYISTARYRSDIISVIQGLQYSLDGISGAGLISNDATNNVYCTGILRIDEMNEIYSWFREGEAFQEKRDVWRYKKSKAGPNTIVMAKVYVDYRYNERKLGVIAILINKEAFCKRFLTTEQDALIYILDSDGVVMSGNDNNMLGKQYDEFFDNRDGTIKRLSDSEKYISVSKAVTDNITCVYMVPNKITQKQVLSAVGGIAVAFIICFGAALCLAFFISKKMSRPLETLADYMRRVEHNEYTALELSHTSYEVDEVCQSYNSMVEKLNEQINHTIAMEFEIRDAQIEAYESQINPHFIFNTLQLIQMLSIMKKNDAVNEVALCLGKMLRFNLYEKKEVMVSDEIASIENYFKILKLRYEDELEYHIIVADSVKNAYILKFILQPIMENAMKHGIEKVERKGEIWVYVKEVDNEVVMIVRDNGIGMSEDTLLKVKEKISDIHSKNGIGLKNVNQRIKLFYGEKYGINIYSEYDKKTDVVIYLPKTKTKIEEQRNDGEELSF